MKSNCFYTVLDETTLELDVSLEDTISRLRKQQGVCRESDSDGTALEFICTRKGYLRIYDIVRPSSRSSIHRMYYLRGQVVSENGKTKITYATVYDRTEIVTRWISIIFEVLLLILCVAIQIFNRAPVMEYMFFALCLVISVGITLSRTKSEVGGKTTDIEIMKKELQNRVEAVSRWND